MAEALPGTCQGLVLATEAVAINVDALREQVICLRQALQNSFPPASYLVERDALLIRAIASQTEALCQVIQQVGFLVARTDAPELPSVEFEEPLISDIQLHPECTSQYYCPPGFVKNQQGICVPIV